MDDITLLGESYTIEKTYYDQNGILNLDMSTIFDKLNNSINFDNLNNSINFDNLNNSINFDNLNNSVNSDLNSSINFDPFKPINDFSEFGYSINKQSVYKFHTKLKNIYKNIIGDDHSLKNMEEWEIANDGFNKNRHAFCRCTSSPKLKYASISLHIKYIENIIDQRNKFFAQEYRRLFCMKQK